MYGQWTRIWWKSTGTLRLDTTTAPNLQDGTRVERNLKKERSLLLFHELSLHVKPRWRNWKDFIWKNFPIYGSVCSDACHKRAIWGMLEANDLSLAASSSFLCHFIHWSWPVWRNLERHAAACRRVKCNLKHRVKTAQSVTFPSTSSFTIICRNCVDVKEAVSQSSGPGAVNWS